MTVRIRLFAHMAQHARTVRGPGGDRFSLEVPDGATVDRIPDLLRRELPDLPWPASTLLAVNQHYVPPGHPLNDNDEVAVIPPVSGGLN